ncbi:MAG: hypothetical protein EA344_09155 [Alkalicoccus sp.]|nr:MAG: hypothetical protein EA344_09155 [Alkalicoccus sp.]
MDIFIFHGVVLNGIHVSVKAPCCFWSACGFFSSLAAEAGDLLHGRPSGSEVFCLHQHWTVTELFDKEMASLRNGGDACGISAQSDHGAGQTVEDQPRSKKRSLYTDWNKYSDHLINKLKPPRQEKLPGLLIFQKKFARTEISAQSG